MEGAIANVVSTLVNANISMTMTSILDEIKLHYKYKTFYNKAYEAK